MENKAWGKGSECFRGDIVTFDNKYITHLVEGTCCGGQGSADRLEGCQRQASGFRQMIAPIEDPLYVGGSSNRPFVRGGDGYSKVLK
jgi:hypothetical protein